MKAAVTTGKRREIVVRDIPKPDVQAGMLLMKTRYCSICGSDLEYLNGDFEWRGKCGELHADAILGHEFCAEVAEVGNGVEGWSVGDRATVGGGQPCGDCYFCRRRLYHLCYGGRPRQVFYNEHVPDGYGGKNGAFSEFFLARPTGLLRLPDSVSDEEGALVEPFNVGVSAVQVAGLKAGDSVVILGAGKIGIGAMLAAKVSGLSPLIITDQVQSRLDKALEMGADAVFNPDDVDVISEVVKLTEEGPDAVIIAVREGKVLNQAIDMVRRGGIISLVIIAAAGIIATLPSKPATRVTFSDQSVEALKSRRRMLRESMADVERLKSSSEIPPDAYLARMKELRGQLAETETGLRKAGESIQVETFTCPHCGGTLPLGRDKCDFCGQIVVS